MKIEYYRSFEKAIKKLDKKCQSKVFDAIRFFQENPLNPALKNHKLRGAMNEKRAISVTGDIRIIFREYENYTLVLMLDVGTHTHTQVYDM